MGIKHYQEKNARAYLETQGMKVTVDIVEVVNLKQYQAIIGAIWQISTGL